MPVYHVSVDIAAPSEFPAFEILAGKTVEISITLLENGEAYGLTGKSVRLQLERPDKTLYTLEQGIAIDGIAANILCATLEPDIMLPGSMRCIVCIFDSAVLPDESVAPQTEIAFCFVCRKEAVRKQFLINLDTKRSTSNRDFEVVDGDNGNVLCVTLTDDGNPVDMRDCFVMAVFSKPDGSIAQQDNRGNGVMIYGAQGNEAEIALYLSSISPGLVECELLVFSGEDEDTLITSARFNFGCRRSIANKTTISNTEEWPFLIALGKSYGDAEEIRCANESMRIANEDDRVRRDRAFAVFEAFDPGKDYVPLNKVVYQGCTYVCIAACRGMLPSDSNHWLLCANRGADGKGAVVQIDMLLRADGWGPGGLQTILDGTIVPESVGYLRLAQAASAEAYAAYAALRPQVVAQAMGSITIAARGATPSMDIPTVLEVHI